jgi:hypothetical protein
MVLFPFLPEGVVMDDRGLRTYEMLMRVRDFGAEQAASFPPASLGAELFAQVSAAATELGNNVAKQVSGSTSAQQGTATKAVARAALRDGLERLRRTARSMAPTMPGLDSKFRIPRNATDQELLGVAEAFLADATPLSGDFRRFAMPADFLAELEEHIAEFRTALSSQQSGRGHQVMATAAIDDTLEGALSAVQQLEAIVGNTFEDDPARLAGWTSARHIARSARKRTTEGTPTTPAPTPAVP